MDRMQYTNLAQAWGFVEDHALSRQTPAMAQIRAATEKAGMVQGSAAQAETLSMLAHLTGAKSVIVVGTGW